MASKEPKPEFIPAPKVLERYGVSDMTLWRWLKDPALGFPRPVYIGRFRYFRISELDAWERALPRELAAADEEAATAERDCAESVDAEAEQAKRGTGAATDEEASISEAVGAE